MYYSKTLMFLILLNVCSVHSIEIDVSQNFSLDSVINLPINNLKVVEANGELLFMSENGRFVLRGELYDIWHKTRLSTANQVQNAATKIHFDQMGLDWSHYNTLNLGTGDQQVVIFVDPLCRICHKLIKDISDIKDDYTFILVVVPALGDDSDVRARKVFCAKNPNMVFEAFMNQRLMSLSQKPSCDYKYYDETLILAQLLNIKAVPFIVASDGRYSQGRPPQFKSWLEGKG